VPLDYGCRPDQHHRVDDLRPNPVERHPQEPIQGGKLGPTGSLSPQDGHLMSQGNKLKFQRGATAHTEFQDRNKDAENRHYDREQYGWLAKISSLTQPYGILSKDSYSITSSASASKGGGIVRPSVLAVFRLTTSSNLVDSSTGRSTGFVPRRILSV
jgi:hypothetical protein